MDDSTTDPAGGATTSGEVVQDGAPDFAMVPREMLRDSSISAGAMRCWILIQDHSSPTRPRPWPSRKRLAGFMGVTERTVGTYLAELQEAGWLRVEARSGTSNLYSLVWQPRKHTSRGGRKSASWGVGKSASREEEPVEAEPLEEEAPYSPPLPPEPPQLDTDHDTTYPWIQLHTGDPFDTWWQTYPSTKGKQAARKAWDRLTPTQRTQAGKALANYLTALDTHRHNGGTPPVMHASTFLNGRWIDWTADNTPDPAWPQPRRPARAAQQTDEAKELAHRIADQVRARRAAR